MVRHSFNAECFSQHFTTTWIPDSSWHLGKIWTCSEHLFQGFSFTILGIKHLLDMPGCCSAGWSAISAKDYVCLKRKRRTSSPLNESLKSKDFLQHNCITPLRKTNLHPIIPSDIWFIFKLFQFSWRILGAILGEPKSNQDSSLHCISVFLFFNLKQPPTSFFNDTDTLAESKPVVS